ncbi:HECT-domain-containing protein [Wolfiporia cocos MD-104 SS10]|uniref:HECT-type E3 ubiquitin transferase n=1 Tax=Wolfiporia cocos (strain MD-104) TaxID=742152 RepID=A0A2H3JJB4_WOLCO|nr:HECT-domain-containing protein [Wolfiporia cocos MD-104 SS10]
MNPLFGDDLIRRRKEINLGGTRTAAGFTDILHDVKAQRTQRQDLKRRLDSAMRIQTWWRGVAYRRLLREHLRRTFAEDVIGINGLRCLMLLGGDEDTMGTWARTVAGGAQGTILHDDPSWRFLLRRTALLLLRSVSNSPESQNALPYLSVLLALQSNTPSASEYTRYLLQNGYYEMLGRAIVSIPVDTKTSPSLPPLVSLITLPLSKPDLYNQCIRDVLLHILTIPLLPNRLPLQALSALSAVLPLSSLHLLSPSIADIVNNGPLSTAEAKLHLLANLVAFTPPRYSKLSADALNAYLELTTALMASLPTNAVEPPEPNVANSNIEWGDDEDYEYETQVSVVSSFEPAPAPLPQLDKRTRTRLQTYPSPQHLTVLLAAARQASQPILIAFCSTLTTIWASRKDKVLTALVAYNGGGIIRELYRLYIRSSPLGQDDQLSPLTAPSNKAAWPPMLLLIDLYTHSLLTMADDEFFGSGKLAGVARNPLMLDELIVFSRQLLNIAFALYWRESPTNVQENGVPGLTPVKWEHVRDKVTKLLQAIHARDSRRPFTPPDHWLITSQVDMVSFVDVAVMEERDLVQTDGARSLSKRQLAYVSPRLGVLNSIPFAIPFEVRVSIFRSFIQNDKTRRGEPESYRWSRRPISVRRGMVAQDGFNKLQEADLHRRVEIEFVDQFGQPEAGIDGGGVFKEFLTSLCKEVFDSDRGLWLANKKNELYPNPHSYATESHSLEWYRFIGRILGKALYDGILIDVAFAGFFLAKWLGKQSFLDDLASLDPDLYQGLIFLKHYTGDPEELSLNFTVAEEEFGVAKTVELIPNGSNIPVSRENRLQYIYLVSHYRLNKQIRRQSEAFFDGLSTMIDPKWLRMFNQQELQILLGGVNAPVDLEDMRKHTVYGGLYNDHHPTIEKFWKVVNTFDHEQRRALLRFATSCSRPPLLGFGELRPNFSIRDAGSDENRLPTASTCVNLLKLPRYENEQTLRNKLLQAITSNAGFDLS